jgi:phage FluMu protein Com
MAKRYQSVNQNLYIEEELTTQWPKDTKGVNPHPYIEEELTTQWPKDTKGVIRIRISNKN